MRHPTPAATRCVLALVVLLAGCGGQPAGPVPLTAPPLAADAPVPTVPPAGRVVTLDADRPEGIAVDGSTVVLDTQQGRLLVLSGTGAVVRTVVLGGSGRHVRTTGGPAGGVASGPAGGLAGGLALVPLEGAGALAVVDLVTGTVTAVRVGRAPHDVVPIPGGRALVGDEADGAVTVVDLTAGRAVGTLPAGLQPGGLAADGDWAAAVDVRGRYLYRYRVAAGGVTSAGRLAVGDGPTHVVDLGGGTVAVADAIGHAVDLVSLPRLALLRRIPLPAAPEGLAADHGRLWVTLPGLDRLVELDPSSGGTLAAYPTVQQPNSVAVDPATGTVYVPAAVPGGGLQIVHP